MEEYPNLYRLARNKETMAIDYWTPNEEGGFWNIELRQRLNDWEIEDLANLYGKVHQFQ